MKHLLIILLLIVASIPFIQAKPTSEGVEVFSSKKISTDSLHDIRLDNDSIVVTQLKEVVVMSERSWFENGIYNFIPTAKEKQLSNSPGTLINVMKTSLLRGDSDGIYTLTGESVSIAINGELANEVDLATFWPKRVKKVEYIQNPTDPKYMGVKNVVNFIIAEYQAGGITRINVEQSYPILGQYDLASKLNYKRMTFGAKFGAYYKDFKGLKSDSETTYRDIYYDGVKYDEILQKTSDTRDNKDKDFDITLNAKYISDKLTASHTFSVGWIRRSGNHNGTNIWSANLFDSDGHDSFSSNRSASYTLNGQYNITFNPKWVLNAGWMYGFSNNNSYAWNRLGDEPKVENNVSEKVNMAKVYCSLFYYIRNNFLISLQPNTKLHWFVSRYTGSADESQTQFREDFHSALYIYWRPISSLYLLLYPNLNCSRYKVSHIVNSTNKPAVDFSFNWTPSRTLYLSGNVKYVMFPLNAEKANPVTIKSSSLKWVKGNPYLKPYNMWVGSATFSYRPTEILSSAVILNYFKTFNALYYTYKTAPEDMGGYIATSFNAPPADEFNGILNLDLSLLNRRLNFFVSPCYFYKKARGEYYRTLSYFRLNGGADLIIGNCRLYINYSGRQKSMGDAGECTAHQGGKWSVGVSYGWKDFYMDFKVSDLFHTKYIATIESFSDVVSDKQFSEGIGRSFRLNLTYTFGYGKKINGNLNIQRPTVDESSILSL